MNNLTIGTYYPGHSFVHRLDPRIKILLSILFMVTIFLVESFWGYLYIGIFFGLVVLISGVPVKMYLKSIKPLMYLIIFTFVMNVIFMTGDKLIFSIGPLKIYWEGVEFSIFMALRLVFLVTSASVMTLTTSPVALADGLERLLKPLKVVKFPVHELSMMMTIALRFIPTLMEEVDRIKKAQMARGADFETGGIKKRAMAMIPLIVPLFVSALRRADDLAMAMEARCYRGGEGRTAYKVLKMSMSDYLALLTMVAFGVFIFFLG